MNRGSAVSKSTHEEGPIRRCGKTYITQILHDVVELLSLFVFIAYLFDGLLAHKVFRDFRPHFVFLWLFGLETSPSVSGVNHSKLARFLRLFAFASSDTIQVAAAACFALKDNVFIVVTTVPRATGRGMISIVASPWTTGAQPVTNLYTLITHRGR